LPIAHAYGDADHHTDTHIDADAYADRHTDSHPSHRN
jgi:hypothetical protein